MHRHTGLEYPSRRIIKGLLWKLYIPSWHMKLHMFGEAGLRYLKRLLLLDRDTDNRLVFLFLALLLAIALFQLDPGPKGPDMHYPDSEVYLN